MGQTFVCLSLQSGSSRRDNGGKPYPSLQSVRGRMMTSKYRHDGLRDLGLGDAVMVSKE